ncbi:hypothetical protein CARUB_v10012743mg, partial [Capsella rubella]
DADISRGASFAVADTSIFETPADTLDRRYIKRSLFMIYIGTEDYLHFIQTNPGTDTSKQQTFVCQVIAQLRNDINTKFGVQLLAPLGCLPVVRQDYNTGNNSCYEPLNDLAKQHNANIGPMQNDFAKILGSNISCCGVGTHQAYGCGKGNIYLKLCDYQRAYLFFDGRHNTEKAQEEMAHLLYSANTNVIKTMNAREFIVYPTGEQIREYYEASTPSPPSCHFKCVSVTKA